MTRNSAEGRDAIAAFAEAIRERPEVLDCYTTMGEWDFMLRVVTRDIKAYEAFYLDHLSKLPNVQSINSSVTVCTSMGMCLSCSWRMALKTVRLA